MASSGKFIPELRPLNLEVPIMRPAQICVIGQFGVKPACHWFYTT